MERSGQKPSCGNGQPSLQGQGQVTEPEIDVGTESDEDIKPTLLLPKQETLETKIEKSFGFSIAELMRK